MLTLHNICYAHPNKELLLDSITLTINKYDKIALIGNNGTGKSTLLQIMAGHLQPSSGTLKAVSKPYYIPQVFGQFNQMTIAQALRVDDKLNALAAILGGDMSDEKLAVLDDDWSIEERCREALSHWQLGGHDLSQSMGQLSGGQKTKVFLAGILIHRPDIVLLDEPSNHLDSQSRTVLYQYIQSTNNTLVVVSHDRTLLNLLPAVYELSKQGITAYGGNYDFYVAQKAIEAHAFQEDLNSKEKALRKAKAIEKETIERQQKLDARGKKKQEKAGLPTISMNTLRNNAEKSTSRIKDVHAEKTDAIMQELIQLRKSLPDKDKMKIGLNDSTLHRGKILITAKDINYGYDAGLLWPEALSFGISSSQRIALKGKNGSGKTTLINMIRGILQPSSGIINRATVNTLYIDQDYSLIDNRLSVLEQAQLFNSGELQEHEVKSRLTHFLFTKKDWDKSCAVLSGGEKMRLLLCCLTISSTAPDMMIMDEPTNNLDIQNIELLTAAINEYKGAMIIVSHDIHFLEQMKTDTIIELPGKASQI